MTNKYTQLFGWEDSGFWLQVFIVHMRQLEELYKTVKCYSTCVCVCIKDLILSLILMKISVTTVTEAPGRGKLN